MCLIACVIPTQAITRTFPPGATPSTEGLRASLITCYPGPEVYELVGHEAIRICGTDANGLRMDSVWNYGVFDFTAPNFLYRFVKGETDYMVQGYPFSWFLPQYEERGSRVVEQRLDLTQAEVNRLRRLLQLNSLPDRRVYRYNYVRDNCSTRVASMLDSAVAPRHIIYPRAVEFPTFRSAMRYYHQNYPWYQFGIDIALGSGIDVPVDSRMEQFAPLRLMEEASEARFKDGTPLVSSTEVLYPGIGPEDADPATAPPVAPATPWWLTPMAFALLLFAASACTAVYEWRRKTIVRWWMSLFFTMLGLAGCVVWFLVFVSSHDSTSPNILCLWLNPLQLVVAAGVWWRRTRPLAMSMCVVNLVVLVLLTAAWPLQTQQANPAVFPLWGATLCLSAAYTLLYPALSSGSPAPAKGFPGNLPRRMDSTRRHSSQSKNTNGRKTQS